MENDQRMSPELPDVIIQHIQSFLEPDEEARTMLVSKSWLRAWSTRPFLFYNTVDHLCLQNKSRYIWLKNRSRYTYVSSHVIDRTVESYVDKGIPIVKFHLFVDRVEERWLKMVRQTNVIDLHLRARSNWTTSLFQEIFLIKSLQFLSIASSQGVKTPWVTLSDIKCLNLRKLEFRYLQIGQVTFRHILSSCPLIEELLLDHCKLVELTPSYNNLGFQLCKRLKRLSLTETQINDELLHTILSKSSHLEEFNLIRCSKLVRPINLSSISLKRVNLDMRNVQVVIFDAPNLHKLKFNSCRLWATPFPTITIPIIKGTVKVTILYRDGDIDKSWFYGLKEFLANFAKSNVKLTSNFSHPLRTKFKLLKATPLPPRNEIETLRFKRFKYRTLLYAFFSICHPKIVLLDRLDTISNRKHLIELLKDISYRRNLAECCSFNDEKKCWRHYIKDVKLYYGIDDEKKLIDMNGLETRLGSKEMITLAIEWQSSY